MSNTSDPQEPISGVDLIAAERNQQCRRAIKTTDALGFLLELTIKAGDYEALGSHKCFENHETGKVDAGTPHEIRIKRGITERQSVMVAAHEAYHLFKSVAHLITCNEETEAETFGELVTEILSVTEFGNDESPQPPRDPINPSKEAIEAAIHEAELSQKTFSCEASGRELVTGCYVQEAIDKAVNRGPYPNSKDPSNTNGADEEWLNAFDTIAKDYLSPPQHERLRRLLQEADRAIRESEDKPQPQPISGVDLIAAERNRQCRAIGWTADHDDGHVNGEIAAAAACYLMVRHPSQFDGGEVWPWDMGSYKPSSDTIENLVRAGALIAAEIDRIQRQRERERVSTENYKRSAGGPTTQIKQEDSRPQLGAWAPGNYLNTCYRCACQFMGDKRAVSCADCAYAELEPSQTS